MTIPEYGEPATNVYEMRLTAHEYGSFYGRIDGTGQLHPRAAKGAVLTARILWSFSAAYRVLGCSGYLEMSLP